MAQQAPPVYISEVATRGTGPAGAFQDYIEITNPSFSQVPIGGLQLQAMAGQQLVTIPIPMGVVLGPRQMYTIAHAQFTGCVPDQVFTENLPSTRSLQLLLGTPGGARVDVATVPPHPAGWPGCRFTGSRLPEALPTLLRVRGLRVSSTRPLPPPGDAG
ncbi:lamin tail domain-containing protein [Kibdelosporangium aridum]|uniref:lamin tail domain-containing protein n=1 Tax=Kibdelosporangium aridum TaxID=2030 RepID=UPI000A046C14|nr:lamin tail domain-containing protein [Kibdelosporangium aridum]